MSEKKNIVPIVVSVIAHIILIGFFVWNFSWDDEQQDNKYVDAPVQAKLVTAPDFAKPDATQTKPKKPQPRKPEPKKPEPKPEPVKEEPKKEEPKVDEEKLKQQELEKQELEKQRLEQERQKQLEIEKQKKIEQEKQQKLEEEKKRKEDEARKQKEQEEAEKKRLAEEKRKKEEAERKKREQELADLEAAMAAQEDEFFEAELDSVRQGQILSEVEKLTRLITAKIKRNWYPPSGTGACSIRISMGPSGSVLATEILGGDDEYCQTGELAIQKSDPLPYSDEPKVMAQLKTMTITFDPSFKN